MYVKGVYDKLVSKKSSDLSYTILVVNRVCNKIKLGNIYSKDFDQNVKLLMDRFKDKKCKLNFYSHSITSSGIKFGEISVTGSCIIMELDLSSYVFEDLDYKLLIEKKKLMY